MSEISVACVVLVGCANKLRRGRAVKLRADWGGSSAPSRSSRLGSVSSPGYVDASAVLRSTADASRHPRLETEPSSRHALVRRTQKYECVIWPWEKVAGLDLPTS